MRIAVTGYNGQVATALSKIAEDYPSLTLEFYSRSDWDITQKVATKDILQKGYDYIVNTAAYTLVDRAESESQIAHEVNTHALEIMSDECNRYDTGIIHLSTDYVYHNGWSRPLRETDPVLPKSIYAKTKLAGEIELGKRLSKGAIFRTSWVYSSWGHNFVKTMSKLVREKDELRIVADQWGCPTSAIEIAHHILSYISKSNDLPNNVPIFNLTEKGWTSWYEMTLFIRDYFDADCNITPIRTKDYPTPASRPHFSILNCEKYDHLNLRGRKHWKEAILPVLISLSSK